MELQQQLSLPLPTVQYSFIISYCIYRLAYKKPTVYFINWNYHKIKIFWYICKTLCTSSKKPSVSWVRDSL